MDTISILSYIILFFAVVFLVILLKLEVIPAIKYEKRRKELRAQILATEEDIARLDLKIKTTMEEYQQVAEALVKAAKK